MLVMEKQDGVGCTLLGIFQNRTGSCKTNKTNAQKQKVSSASLLGELWSDGRTYALRLVVLLLSKVSHDSLQVCNCMGSVAVGI